MKKTSLLGLVAILFLSTFASAQFPKFKIPKIKKPKIDKIINKDIGISSSLSSSSKGNNRQEVLDDGFTFFEAIPVEEYNQKYRGKVSKGWTMYIALRAFGTYPDGSSFKTVVGKNGKPLATYRCASKITRKADSPISEVKNSPDDDHMYAKGRGCGGKKEIFVKNPGEYNVQVFSVNGDNDNEKLLRTYKIDVREAKKTRPGGVPGASDYYIQRHAEAPISFLYLRTESESYRLKPDYRLSSSASTLYGNVELYFNMSRKSSLMKFSDSPKVRCSVNGKRLKLSQAGNVVLRSVRTESGKFERDNQPGQHVNFHQYYINLPINWKNSNNSNNPEMSKMAGDWKCELRNVTETIRTFTWTVGNNGFPEENPEQASGNINLHWGTYLIDMEIPQGGSSFDERLLPMPNAGMFYGIPWTSEKGKKAAGAVPNKGDAYHQP